MKKFTVFLGVIGLTAALLISGCSKEEKTIGGVLLGAGVGAAIGAAAGNGTGAAIGAVAGAGVGGVIGHSMGDDDDDER